MLTGMILLIIVRCPWAGMSHLHDHRSQFTQSWGFVDKMDTDREIVISIYGHKMDLMKTHRVDTYGSPD